jgi:hypothetical protein
MNIHEEFLRCTQIKQSDIYEHLPTLQKYADECNHITEFGVRYADGSTVAFLNSKAKLISYDIVKTEGTTRLLDICKENNKEWILKIESTTECEIEETDMLFIDTEHTHDQVTKELRVVDKVKKYIAFHDTDNVEVMRAIFDFMKLHKDEWVLEDSFENCHGLIILRRPDVKSIKYNESTGQMKNIIEFINYDNKNIVDDSKHDYIIVTEYCADNGEEDKVNFFDTWWDNTMKYTKTDPNNIFVINSDGYYPKDKKGKWIDLCGNLGHVTNNYNMPFDGYQTAIMMAALMAHISNKDLIFKDQDCLVFGDWISQLYTDAKVQNKLALLGQFKSDPIMSVQNSLVFIKKEFLLEFIFALQYVTKQQLVKPPLSELKMRFIKENILKDYIGFMSLCYGRDRPINYDDKVFYVSQVGYHKHDIAIQTTNELKARGLI